MTLSTPIPAVETFAYFGVPDAEGYVRSRQVVAYSENGVALVDDGGGYLVTVHDYAGGANGPLIAVEPGPDDVDARNVAAAERRAIDVGIWPPRIIEAIKKSDGGVLTLSQLAEALDVSIAPLRPIMRRMTASGMVDRLPSVHTNRGSSGYRYILAPGADQAAA